MTLEYYKKLFHKKTTLKDHCVKKLNTV